MQQPNDILLFESVLRSMFLLRLMGHEVAHMKQLSGNKRRTFIEQLDLTRGAILSNTSRMKALLPKASEAINGIVEHSEDKLQSIGAVMHMLASMPEEEVSKLEDYIQQQHDLFYKSVETNQ